MANRIIQTGTLTDIADAIRAKTGGTSAMTPAEMVTEIASISGGGGTDLAAVDVFVGDYLSPTELSVSTGAVDRYRRYIVGG